MPGTSRGRDSVHQGCSDSTCATRDKTSGGSAQGTVEPQCPGCGARGRRVERRTLQALLTSEALRRLDGQAYRFCASRNCQVVYFSPSPETRFLRRDLSISVGQKEVGGEITLCYCFNYTTRDIREDQTSKGRTDIPSIIRSEVKAGHCACEVPNPAGACCLGEVQRTVREIESERAIGTR